MIISGITYLDYLLFFIVSVPTVYMLFFAVAALFNHAASVDVQKQKLRFIVLVVSHKQDRTICQAVNSILGQNYPQRQFDVTVISDHQQEMTNMRLAQMPITLLTPNLKDYTPTKLLQYAIVKLPRFKQYDVALILEGNCFVDTDFLEQANNTYISSGTKCLQTHLVSRTRNNTCTHMDAVANEINNSIFRRGHISIGLSAALNHAGTVFDFAWFNQAIMKAAEDNGQKSLEAMLIHDRIFIDYTDFINVYVEKQLDEKSFNKLRSSWAKMQRQALVHNLQHLPTALLHRQYDMLNKLLQWLFVPRTTMLAIILFMDLVVGFIRLTWVLKWWAVSAVLMLAFALATPNYLVDSRWNKTFLYAPFVIYRRFLRKPKQLIIFLKDAHLGMAVRRRFSILRDILRRSEPDSE